MDDPGEPQVRAPHDQGPKPVETYEGTAAIVRLFSWGTERSPAYSLNVVRFLEGRRTCGRTFTGGSLAELRQAAPGYTGQDQPTLDDIEHCLALADRQTRFPFIDDDEATL